MACLCLESPRGTVPPLNPKDLHESPFFRRASLAGGPGGDDDIPSTIFLYSPTGGTDQELQTDSPVVRVPLAEDVAKARLNLRLCRTKVKVSDRDRCSIRVISA